MFCPPNHTARYLRAGISGRLGSEIVRSVVDHYGAANDVRYAESTGGYCGIRITVARQQRREIPCVAGVGRFFGIVVAAGVCKAVTRTTFASVDVKAKESRLIGRQSPYVSLHEYTSVPLIESHLPV